MTPVKPDITIPSESASAGRRRFVRTPPPVLAQYLIGGWIYGIAAPMIKTAEKLGWGERLMSLGSGRRNKVLEKRNPFRHYTAGPQDVFVMTYAKSGTNWMMQIAHQLIYHGKAEFDHLHEVVPWPDVQAMTGLPIKYAIPLKDADDWKSAPERLRVIKTHLNWEYLPYSPEAHYIAVIRDPKDVFVSSYFFIESVLGPAMPSVETWYKFFLSDKFMLGGSWAVNAAGYWAQRHRPNVMITSFKSMKRDLHGTVSRVADFLNIRVPDSVIDAVGEKASFEYMKKIDHKFHIGKIIPWREPGSMIRKGKQGGSSELLTLEQQRDLDAHFQAELKRLGSDFPYEEFAELA